MRVSLNLPSFCDFDAEFDCVLIRILKKDHFAIILFVRDGILSVADYNSTWIGVGVVVVVVVVVVAIFTMG